MLYVLQSTPLDGTEKNISQHELYDNEVQVLIACRKHYSTIIRYTAWPHTSHGWKTSCSLLTKFLHKAFRVEHNEQSCS